jgi:hypothetical protein
VIGPQDTVSASSRCGSGGRGAEPRLGLPIMAAQTWRRSDLRLALGADDHSPIRVSRRQIGAEFFSPWKIAYDLRAIRVASLPFLAAVVLPLLNFAMSPQAPKKSLPIILVASGVSWWLHDLIALMWRLRKDANP